MMGASPVAQDRRSPRGLGLTLMEIRDTLDAFVKATDDVTS